VEVRQVTLSLAEKKEVVANFSQLASNASLAIIAEYRGLTVEEMTDLRSNARKNDVELRVVKNTLLRRALENTQFNVLHEALNGCNLIALSKNEPNDAAKLLRDFSKKHNKLEVKALSVGGKLFSANAIDKIANLPTREAALSKLLFIMKAPIEKLVRTLAEPQAKLVRTLAAIRDKNQSA
jgi:large subunit ribosomal protein L10